MHVKRGLINREELSLSPTVSELFMRNGCSSGTSVGDQEKRIHNAGKTVARFCEALLSVSRYFPH